MPEQWMTVAEAAAAMKVHPRTVERRVSAGKIESRRGEDGQTEVFVLTPAFAAETAQAGSSSPPVADALETVREMADRQVDLAAGSASALVRFAQEQAMRAENQLVLARQDADRYRRESHMALALVAAMFFIVLVGVGWGMSTVTNARATARSASEKAADTAVSARQAVADATAVARQAQSDFNVVRNRLDDEVAARSKAEGELIAYKTGASNPRLGGPSAAATQPANLLDRIGDLFVGQRSR